MCYMESIDVYMVSDYNPKYLDSSIISVVSRMLSEIKKDVSNIKDFKINIEDEVNGLSQNSAKAVLKAQVVIDTSDEIQVINEINGNLREQISSEAIYSITATSSESAKEYGY